MVEVAIISGKGGTGKSIISAALASLSRQVLLADCDVDAANLYLIFDPVHEEEQVYIGSKHAIIDPNLCNSCGLCQEYCRFGAILDDGGQMIVSEILCDGCQLCSRICPRRAIRMIENNKSRMFAGPFRNGWMVYGKLAPGEENSGKLVNLVRDKARKLAKKHQIGTIIIDGPPGIGCSAISSITGADHVVIVTEPSLTGLHDLKRVHEMVSAFSLKAWVIINKADLNPVMASQIEDFCVANGITLAGQLPFDPLVVEAMVQCKSITEWAPEADISKEIIGIWRTITGLNELNE
ncbi:MAG: ATP-binding protein [Bacteroidales bacterium]